VRGRRESVVRPAGLRLISPSLFIDYRFQLLPHAKHRMAPMKDGPTAKAITLPRKRAMFASALRRRCPVCGGGGLFQGWLKMRPSCPTCGLNFNRGESGYALGAMWFNLLAAEAVTVGICLATIVNTWPDVPWGVLQVSGPVEALATPLLFYPFSKTLFLAFDLCFRPIDIPAGRPA
jgi:uncharacterized protein (DUF983 family)